MRKSGATREVTWPLIRKAAIDLLYAHGFNVMNLRQLSSAAGLQAGSLYNYFSSKDDLLIRLITEILEEMLKQLDEAIAAVDDPVERVNKMVEILVVWHTKRRKETYIGHMEMRSLPEEHYRAYVALRDRFEKIFLAAVVAGCKSKIFQVSDPKIATVSALAMLTGIANWYRPNGKLSVRELITIYQEMVLNLLGMQKAKTRGSQPVTTRSAARLATA